MPDRMAAPPPPDAMMTGGAASCGSLEAGRVRPVKGSSIDPFRARSLEEGLDADVCVLAVEHLRRTCAQR